jgi:diphthamide synthase (EF-2-diphthine--ammonia ligase)
MPRDSILLSWSGGKDSTLTLATLRANPTVEVIGLLTSITSDEDMVSVHRVRRHALSVFHSTK